MIDRDGRIICEDCLGLGYHQILAEVRDMVLIIKHKRSGARHVVTQSLHDILPKPDTEEYASLVADLLRRMPAMA